MFKYIILLPLFLFFGCSAAAEPTHITPDPYLGMAFFHVPRGTDIGDTITTMDGWFLETSILKGLASEAAKKSKKESLTLND